MSAARAVSFLFLLCSFALPAQQKVVDREATPSNQAPPAEGVTLAFRGGTMKEFVAALRAVEPKANIVVATAVADAKLPAIDLRGAGLGQALSSACMVAEAENPVRVTDFHGPGEPVYSIVAAMPATVAGPAGPEVARPQESTQVFSLFRLTEPDLRMAAPDAYQVETILSAIEAGTSDDPKKAVLRYHRDSHLLFLRGSRAQLSIVKDLLSSLERDLEERRRRTMVVAPKEAKEADKPDKKD